MLNSISWITTYKWPKIVGGLLFSISILAGCQKDMRDDSIKIIEVASALVNCTGVAPMQCMKIKEIGEKDWQLFYSSIDGFQFEEGYAYKLEVKVTKKPEPIPADSSSLQWTLVKVISKDKAVNNSNN